jgi:hydroxyethylthiazole kinase-like uncharacterized protein yjeF
MIPIVTPEQMAAIDAAALEPVDVLIDRAGAAVARAARAMLGGTYGRRVVVLAGKGNNGNDGRVAARRLAAVGVRVTTFDALRMPGALPPCDLVIDAAYGTGFRGTFEAPTTTGQRPLVLAVDIPSGVSGLTGEAGGRPMAATCTVTFVALKPGLLLGDGPALAGDVTVADIGLDPSSATAHLVEAVDVSRWLPARPRYNHKWRAACWVIAGSPGMTGAAHLASRAAQRAGAGYVRLSSPGLDDDPMRPTEAVGHPLPAERWDRDIPADIDRFAALAVGPGLGTAPGTAEAIRRVVGEAKVSTVVDGDGLTAIGEDAAQVLAHRHPSAGPAVLTPHDGEFARLAGHAPGADRIGAARAVAGGVGAVVLLKGPATVVATPDGRVLVSTTGDSRLATAGTGDVLTGTIAALLAQGMEGPEAAAAGAFLHGRAGALAWRRGLVAGDLVDRLPAALAELPEV